MKPEFCGIYTVGQLKSKEASYNYFIARSHLLQTSNWLNKQAIAVYSRVSASSNGRRDYITYIVVSNGGRVATVMGYKIY